MSSPNVIRHSPSREPTFDRPRSAAKSPSKTRRLEGPAKNLDFDVTTKQRNEVGKWEENDDVREGVTDDNAAGEFQTTIFYI